jgi:hypothetical protein
MMAAGRLALSPRERETTMYAYIQTEPNLWTVGHYTPSGKFISESDHKSTDDAAARVHWLNGGNTDYAGVLEELRRDHNSLAEIVYRLESK